jgi:L-seryl-tRNA(Ser) seleniumtransferase
MIELPSLVLRQKAQRLLRLLRETVKSADAGANALIDGISFSLVETRDAVGGGAFPTDTLPGFGVAIRNAVLPAEKLAASLRNAAIPVIAAVRDDAVILHVRTLLDGDEKRIAAALGKQV